MRFTSFYNQHFNSVLPQRLARSNRQRWIAPLSAIALIGLGTTVWVGIEAINPAPSFANASQITQASTERLDLYVERWTNETYETLWRRSQDAALANAQQLFDRDRQISKVVIMVTAESNGAVAPLLTLEVSRDQWERQIQPERWITNVTSSKTLLGFEKPKPATVDALNSEAQSTQASGNPL
jgi:hypothetical protein